MTEGTTAPDNGPHCRKCGAPVGPEARQGFCPRCLLLQAMDFRDVTFDISGLESAPPAPRGRENASPTSRQFGDYELFEELGRGGMGIVYRARQFSLDREVAVKLLHFGPLASDAVVKRLRMEATTAGCLRHPNIVAIHEVGIYQDQHYLVMDYVVGPNLATFCANQPLPARHAAALLKTVADAVHYAHERGVLHRDLKPSNILMEGSDRPHVTDFGLAKRFEAPISAAKDERQTVEAGTLFDGLTLSGQVLGSPNYMPPEQVSAKAKIGRPCDVYSLGAILYHLLTGRPPFVGETITATLHQVLETEAASPRLLNPRVPVDLETICLKCLEKEPERRYTTASALAEELRRFLNGEPIVARPVGWLQRVWRWSRRNPVVASLASATMLLLLTVGIGSPIAALRIDRERKQVEQQKERAEQERQRLVAEQAETRRLLYAANLYFVQQAWEQSNLSRMRQLLDQTRDSESRGLEWYFWAKQLRLALKSFQGHHDLVNSVAVSPNGRWLASGSVDHTARVWELATGREAFTLRGHKASVNAVAWFPDGQRIATASEDHQTKIWNAANGAEIGTFQSQRGRVKAVAVSLDGRRVASGNQDGTVSLWDSDGGGEIMTLTGHARSVLAVAFSPDNRFLATGSADETARLWEISGGQTLRVFPGHSDYVVSIAFSPDGQRIVAASDRSAIVWEAATGRKLLTLQGHSDYVRSVAFSPDGRFIATASADRTTKLWDADSGRELNTLNAPTDQAWAVCFSHDGRQLVTGAADSMVRVWDFGIELPSLQFRAGQGHVYMAVPSPDARSIATCDFAARIWDASNGRPLSSFGNSDARSVAFSPDGRWLAIGTESGMVTIRHISTEKEAQSVRMPTAVWAMAFSPDSRTLVTGCFNGVVKVWDVATGREVHALMGHPENVPSAAFSPDGRRILTGAWDNTAKIWDAATGRELLRLEHGEGVMSVAFSPDGKRIVAAGTDTAKIWDAETRKLLLVLRGHSDVVMSAAFSRDGTRILTGSFDRTARLWDSKNGSMLLTLNTTAPVTSAAFSPQDDKIVVARADGMVTQWEPGSAEQMVAWEKEEQRAQERWAQLQRDYQNSLAEQRAARGRDPGVIRQWLLLAPFPALTDRPLDEAFCSPESQLRPAPGDRAHWGEVELSWRAVETSDGIMDFSAWVGRVTEYAAAYAVCHIVSDTEQDGLRLFIGSDDQSKVYLNGKEVYASRFKRGFIEDEDVVEGIRLNAGKNVLIFKVVNETADWKGSLRLTDASGQPPKGIKVTLTP